MITYFKAKGINFAIRLRLLVVTCGMPIPPLREIYSPMPYQLLTATTFLFILEKHLTQPQRRFDRKSLRKDFPDEECFKRLRWTLLKNPDDLSGDEQKTLNQAFLVSPDLQEVYQLRKALKAIFDMDLTKD